MSTQERTADSPEAQPLVSIVMPTYNGAKYLRQSIESCLGQSYEQIELVVVVDGSTDDTLAILAEFSDPRMRVIQHERNRGLPETLNTGFAATRGDLLTWTSDDNWYVPEAVSEMVSFLNQHPKVGFVYTDLWQVDETGHAEELAVVPPELMRSHPWNGVYACFMYRREVYEAVGEYDPSTRLAEDYDYWLRIAEQFEIAALHRRLYYYRRHTNSLTGMHGRYEPPRRVLQVRRQHGWMSWREYLAFSAYLDVDAAFWHKQQGNWAQVRRLALRGLIKNPANVRNVGLISILSESVLGPRATGWLRRGARNLRRTVH